MNDSLDNNDGGMLQINTLTSVAQNQRVQNRPVHQVPVRQSSSNLRDKKKRYPGNQILYELISETWSLPQLQTLKRRKIHIQVELPQQYMIDQSMMESNSMLVSSNQQMNKFLNRPSNINQQNRYNPANENYSQMEEFKSSQDERRFSMKSKRQLRNLENAEDIEMNQSLIESRKLEIDGLSSIARDDYENDDKAMRNSFSPYTYQLNIVKKVRKQWFGIDLDQPITTKCDHINVAINENTRPENNYGSIIFIETGAGKSYISLLLIKIIFGENSEKFEEITKEEKERMLQDFQESIRKSEEMTGISLKRRKVFFLVPTSNLVDQQADVINRYTETIKVGKYHGGGKQKAIFQYENWREEFQRNDVFVFIARKFYDLLIHGYLKMDEIDLLIFDEAHHSNQDHIYNLIMMDFFYDEFELGKSKRPRVLALTASPIKHKVQENQMFSYQIQEFLQILSDNLYSKFIQISDDELNEMKNECDVELQAFEPNIKLNIDSVMKIEREIIQKIIGIFGNKVFLSQLVEITQNIIQLEQQTEDSTVIKDFYYHSLQEHQHDETVLKLLQNRKKFLDLNTAEAKQLNLNDFTNDEDKTIILLLIILLKNTNNLLVELGMIGVCLFIIDLRKELLIKQKSKFQKHGQFMSEVFKEFVLQQLQDFQDILADSQDVDNFDEENNIYSSKVRKLIKILKEEQIKKSFQDEVNQLKAIVFVKDRSVATYLKKILDLHISEEPLGVQIKRLLEDQYARSNEDELPQQQLNSSGSNNRQPLRFGFAIGYLGKSLINKALKSTLKVIEEEVNILESYLPQFSQVKMGKEQLLKSIEAFKKGIINVLIATSVIEEGLDISSCNLVISINEVLNIKSFIQTKGRARQKQSKFIFLHALQEENEVKKSVITFKELIDRIQQIAYREKEIEPSNFIIEMKQSHPDHYFRTREPFRAKCTIREAPIMLDSFCSDLNDRIEKGEIKLDQFRPSDEYGKLIPQSEDNFLHYSSQRFKSKFNIITKEITYLDDKKYFISTGIVPHNLKYFYYQTEGIIKTDKHFTKKKYSINYVQLLAVKQLYHYGLIGADLYPDLNSFIQNKIIIKQIEGEQQKAVAEQQRVVKIVNSNNNQNVQKQEQHNIQNQQIQQKQQVKQKINLEIQQQKQALERQKEEFKDKKKQDLSICTSFIDREFYPTINGQKLKESEEEDNQKAYIIAFHIKEYKEPHQAQDNEEMKMSIVEDSDMVNIGSLNQNMSINQFQQQQRHHSDYQNHQLIEGNNYPFRKCRDLMGILFYSNFQNADILIQMQQESRQIQKNLYYLEKMVEFGIISEEQRKQLEQQQDVLQIEIKPIELNDFHGFRDIFDFRHSVEFYHHWLFYFIYNCQYRFYRRILKRKFGFSVIFDDVIRNVTRVFEKQFDYWKQFGDGMNFLKEVFKFKDGVNSYDQSVKHDSLRPFTVPLVFDRNGQIRINTNMIKDLIRYCKNEIYQLCFSDFQYKDTYDNYNLIPYTAFELLSSNNSDPYSLRNPDQSLSQHLRQLNIIKDRQETTFNKIPYIQCFIPISGIYFIMQSYRSNDQILRHRAKKNGEIINERIKRSDASNKSLYLHNLSTPDQKQFTAFQLSNYDRQGGDYFSLEKCHTNCYCLDRDTDNLWNQNLINFTRTTFKRYRNMRRLGDGYTISQHYFAKNGIYLQQKENENLFVCSRERHFLDLSCLRSSNSELDNSKMVDQSMIQMHGVGDQVKVVNTEFDVPQQYLNTVPIKYHQYQLLQTVCYNYAQFNDVIKIERCIDKYFSDLNVIINSPFGDQPNPNSKGSKNLDLFQWQLTQSIQKKQKDNIVNYPLNYYMKEHFTIMQEALTSPNANQLYDYERLEFYGDSVISFLVILELFLDKSRDYKEGELDFYRIQRVSNMNFAKINHKNKIYEFIISDQQQIFNDIIPPGFKNVDYSKKIKQKHLNEIETKLLFLKKQRIELWKKYQQKLIRDQQEYYQQQIQEVVYTGEKISGYIDKEYLEVVRNLIMTHDLRKILPTNILDVINEERINSFQQLQDFTGKDLLTRIATRIYYQLNYSIQHLILIPINETIRKLESKKAMEKENKMKKQKNVHNDQADNYIPTKQKCFSHKLLADVVESITGSLAFKAGLFTTQEFLLKIEVLTIPRDKLNQELDQLHNYKNDKILAEKYHAISHLEDILGYKFKNPAILIQALTHKSFREAFNARPDNAKYQIEDYERLEFLGDSILNFLVAQHYFYHTLDHQQQYKPKQLHKMKTSIVNNVLLSIVVIQLDIHKFIQYNDQSEQFKKQFDNYIEVVKTELKTQHQTGQLIDLDVLYEHTLKIFGDIMESIIGAIFIDSKNLQTTSDILFKLLMPYINQYGDLNKVDQLQDHGRTKLLELWHSKPYSKNLKIRHDLSKQSQSDGCISIAGIVQKTEVIRSVFKIEQKNKIRKFYRDFFEMISEAMVDIEKKKLIQRITENDFLEQLKISKVSFKAKKDQQQNSNHKIK